VKDPVWWSSLVLPVQILRPLLAIIPCAFPDERRFLVLLFVLDSVGLGSKFPHFLSVQIVRPLLAILVQSP
jgi:hypothetical protein